MDTQFIQDNLVWFMLLVAWSLVWKGMALWRSAKLGQKAWYIALLVINTAGILEILYLFSFSKKQVPPQQPNI